MFGRILLNLVAVVATSALIGFGATLGARAANSFRRGR